MRKSLRNILNKKGLTLVEIIVVLFVSSVLLGIAMGMIVPVKNLMNSIKGNAHLDAVCDTANEYIRGSLQNAAKVAIMKAETADQIDQIAIKAQEYINSASSSSIKTEVRALAVLGIPDPNDSTNTLYRLYDFGVIDVNIEPGKISPTTLSGYLAAPQSATEKYGVFRNSFYEGTSYSVEFKWEEDADKNTLTKEDGTVVQVTDWIKVMSKCYKNGAQMNRDSILSFKIFNGSIEFEESSGDGTGSTVILYTARDIAGWIETLETPTV